MPAHQIDGNNVIEVFQSVRKSIKSARKGGGPTFFECFTYRWRGHVGPSDDLDKGLRSKKELKDWMNRCPINKLKIFLEKEKYLSSEDDKFLRNSIQNEISEAIHFAEISSVPKMSRKLMEKNTFEG